MSYDICLYDKEFLAQAIKKDQDALDNAPSIDPKVLESVEQFLIQKGYKEDSDFSPFKEYKHAKSKWGIQVSVFSSEITFSVPYWDDLENAIIVASEDAKALAKLTSLGYYDSQMDEIKT